MNQITEEEALKLAERFGLNLSSVRSSSFFDVLDEAYKLGIQAAEQQTIDRLAQESGVMPESRLEWIEASAVAVCDPTDVLKAIATMQAKLEIAKEKLIECRSSVKLDYNNWDSLVMRKERDGSLKQYEKDELNRVGALLDYIDAIVSEESGK